MSKEMPYDVALTVDVAAKAATITDEMRKIQGKLNPLIEKFEKVREELWLELGKDPNVQVEDFVYNYNGETKVLTCLEKIEEHPENMDITSFLKTMQ